MIGGDVTCSRLSCSSGAALDTPAERSAGAIHNVTPRVSKIFKGGETLIHSRNRTERISTALTVISKQLAKHHLYTLKSFKVQIIFDR